MKNTSPQPLQMWPGQVELTEAEARTLETLRYWTEAENDPRLRAKFEAQEIVLDAVDCACKGEQSLIDYGSAMEFTAKEILAFQVVAKFVKRQVKASRQMDKQMRKAKREAAERQTG